MNSQSNHYILSGDYESATDNLNMDIMETFISELKKVFWTNESLCHYLDYEGGQHVIEYPKWTKLNPILQTKGQLMGSLLSFPVLCVANAATLGLARKIDDIRDLKACINGDDILFIDSQRTINSWKRIATSMGLIPSIGKNYCSKFFGTINSQLFVRSKRTNLMNLVRTGKFKTILSPNRLDTKAAFENGFTVPDIVMFSKQKLKLTPQSLDIPSEFGGLGKEFNSEKTERRLDRRIYLQLLSELSDVKELGRLTDSNLSIVRGPKWCLKDYRNFVVKNNTIINSLRTLENLEKDSLSTEIEEKHFRLRKNFLRKIILHPVLREFLKFGRLESCIPLPLLKNETVLIPTHLFDSIKVNSKARLIKSISASIISS
jgi:hypothetical protein